jgi:hypothetical protein
MAKIALQKIIWHSTPVIDKDGNATKKLDGIDTGEPDLDRVEIPMDGVVPKTVPMKIQTEWFNKGLVRDDPNIDMPDAIEGPPSMLLPVAGHPPIGRKVVVG